MNFYLPHSILFFNTERKKQNAELYWKCSDFFHNSAFCIIWAYVLLHFCE